MPKISKEDAPNVQEYGPALDISGELDNYTVNFVSIKQTHSLAGMFDGLPGDSCPCPHWGFVFRGKITVTYADREEVYLAGDAFYMPPGHVPGAEIGSEFVQFSPSHALAEVRATMMRNAGLATPS
jgi:quercetin dioxygenase-like cupin family protein